MDDRKTREAEFHDRAFSDEIRSKLWSTYYLVTESSSSFYEDYLRQHCPGRDVLEFGCGPGNRAPAIARSGAASITGIDISPVAIDKASARAAEEGLSDAVEFKVMDAENLAFEDDSLDLVCGTSIIHHLDLEAAYRELSRVLRPDGSAIFVEPLGHNPFINLYRRRTPELRTPDEHPLLMRDIAAAGEWFGRVETSYFHLNSLLAVPLRRTRAFPLLLRGLEATDRALFRALPPVRRYAWQVAIELGNPRGA